MKTLSFGASAALCIVSLTALTAFIVPVANAQVTTYNNRAAFSNAASVLTTIDFNDQLTGGQTYRQYAGGTVTLQGVTFTGNGNLYAVAPAFNPDLYGLGDGPTLTFQKPQSATQTLSVSLPAGTTAFGLDFGAYRPGEPPTPPEFTFALSTGDSFVFIGSLSSVPVTPRFAGFTSRTPISGFSITYINCFAIQGVSDIP